jgi:uncharacterized protein YcbK (DUF882 family)
LRVATQLTVLALGISLGFVGTARADAPGEETEHAQPATAAPKKSKKKRARGPVFSGRLASVNELREEPLDKPSGHIELYAVNFRENLDVELYKEDGTIDEEAVDKLNHMWRCKRTDTEKAIEPRLYEMLSRIYDHFHKRIELVSGFRNQKRLSSFHFHGAASDIRIPGVSDTELHKFVTSLDTGGMGIGIYPRAGFIHVDIRPEPSFRWTDYSPPGSSDMGRSHSPKTKKGKSSKNRLPNS